MDCGNFVGKIIGDYVIISKNRVNSRTKYKVRCNICNIEKWTFNVKKNYVHGTECLGKNRPIGSKLIGVKYGDYKVIKKIVKNNRSSYIVKCEICNSIKESYNLKVEYHSSLCKNFCDFILGMQVEDFMIVKSYKASGTFVDVKCMICGNLREHVSYSDFINNFKNKHSSTCTVKNTKRFKNKKLVKKLFRAYQNINSRIRLEKAYSNLTNNFKDSVDFITYVYHMFEERLNEHPMSFLSIDRINPFGNYEKGNVRCLTLSEQQKNKKIHYKINVETIESSGRAEQVE